MGIADKLANLEFETTTQQTVDEIKRICDQAAEYATGRVAAEGISEDGLTIHFIVRSALRMEIGSFYIDIREVEDRRSVALLIDDFLTQQETLLYFIPIGPKTAPGYRSARDFSEFVQKRLQVVDART